MKYTLVILASGLSRRFGSNKLFYNFLGMPLIEYTLKNLDESSADERIIVFNELNYYKVNGYKVIFNKEPELGISKSIKLSIESISNDLSVFALADMPFVTGKMIDSFVNEIHQNKKHLGMFFCDNLYAPPSAFSREYFNDLMSLNGDHGGKSIIMSNKNDAFFYKVKCDVLYDIDKIEDVEKLHRVYRKYIKF